MNRLHLLKVVLREVCADRRLSQEERVVSITSRMLLRLEQGVKVPERTFHVTIRWHFGEAHREENLAEFGTNLKREICATLIIRMNLEKRQHLLNIPSSVGEDDHTAVVLLVSQSCTS